MDLTKLSKIKLLEKCKELGINKCKSKKKCEIIELIHNHKSIYLQINNHVNIIYIIHL